MLNVESLACQRGGRWLFRDLAFTLNPGQLLHIQGANGSGKTSLLRMLAGLSSLDDGAICWREQSISSAREDYLTEMLYLGHAPAVKDDLSVRENLTVSCRLAGLQPDAKVVRAALETVGLNGRLHLPARVLSQGQRRRLALARLCLDKRPLWILDEPFTALDVHATQWLEMQLEAHLAEGGLVILTTHQTPRVAEQRLHILSIEAGR
ncbi:heme exporter protein A [Novimethylophilus kurashikiensis]|uniref:Heme exporter protein A n=1 Tax=Novimethylophilus kurashikiensis TaxID=1825523 RepID=A0A2R5F2X3_9PROT|nr:cytochrome c biogenesis heme-transporting ATPase CcmA [Novimethylophilus kurashikiensis]GBG12920.1 heme exporter protein A [Novimethylophilus kurashikiensis]